MKQKIAMITIIFIIILPNFVVAGGRNKHKISKKSEVKNNFGNKNSDQNNIDGSEDDDGDRWCPNPQDQVKTSTSSRDIKGAIQFAYNHFVF